MITIEAKISPELCRIEVNGHAGYAPEGFDIYCAGVSALLSTLTLHPGVMSDIAPGHGIVWAEPDNDTITVFTFVCSGLQAMAEAYPDYISFQNC